MDNMMDACKYLSEKGLADIVRANARIFAVYLANRTQPFTVGSNGTTQLDRGTKMLRKDILKAVKTPESLELKAQKIRTESIAKYMRGVMYSGDYPKLGKIFVVLKMIRGESDVHALSGASIAGAHKSRRSPRTGHTLGTPGEYNIAPGGLDNYVAVAAKRIGMAKSAWAECARSIHRAKGDPARGIPAFVKRQRSKHWRVQDNSAVAGNPNFILTNSTPYLNPKLLSKANQDKAYSDAMKNMKRSIIRAVEACKGGKKSIIQSIASSGEEPTS